MDDSEKSYGYSEDIYHGRRPEKSYEYGPEGETGDAEGSDLAPEEEAIHIEGTRSEEPQPSPETREYDYGRDDTDVDSFTWENPPGEEEQRQAEPVSVGRAESEAKSKR